MEFTKRRTRDKEEKKTQKSYQSEKAETAGRIIFRGCFWKFEGGSKGGTNDGD